MSQPSPETVPEANAGEGAAPETTVIEFGGRRPRHPGHPRHPARNPWRDPRVAYVPAGLGATAWFASLVSEWQVALIPEFDSELTHVAGVLALGPFGSGWVVGGMLAVACLLLALRGQPVLRPAARSIGLALVAAQVGVVGALTIQLGDSIAYQSVGIGLGLETIEASLGRGLYLAYAAVALLGLALWLAHPAPGVAAPAGGGRPDPPAGTPPAGTPPAGTASDLTVGPAEPFADPSGTDQWR